MTVADFLLARIAEDLDDARHRYNPRWVAKCKAERRIVEHAERAHELAKVGPSPGDGAWFLAIRYLALPYADHPDYREEWKP